MNPKPLPPEPPAVPTSSLPTIYLAVALAVGFCVQALAFRNAPGIGAAAAGLMLTLAVRFGPYGQRPNHWLIYAAGLAFGALAIRASPVLIALNGLAGVTAVTMAAYSTKQPVAAWTVPQAIMAILVPPTAAIAFGPTTTIRSLPHRPESRIGPVVIGLIVSIPLLLMFGALFASADQVFSDLADRVLGFEVVSRIAGHVVWSVVLGVLLVGLWIFSERLTDSSLDVTVPPPGRATETATVLFLLNGLFAVFVIIQIGYLFGGAEAAATTLADHARRGFFELVTVAGIVLFVILVASWVGHTPDRRSKTVDRSSLALIGLTALVLVSAVRRMFAYWDAYGLTELRVYTTVFMVWIAIALTMMAYSIRRTDTRPFVRVGLTAAMLITLGLTVVNPDALITRTNLERQTAIETDLGYVGGLSIDRAPAIVDYLNTHTIGCESPLLADLHLDIANAVGNDSAFSRSWSWQQAKNSSPDFECGD